MLASFDNAPRLPTILSAGCCALLVGMLVCLAARPLDTNDFWWHLKMGEIFSNQGLWPSTDVLVHTAREGTPPRDAWLFDVAIHAVERTMGFHALRLLHALAVLGTVALVYSLLRRESATPSPALTATGVFLLLSWWRLCQLRPDLLSIPFAFLVYRLLLEPDEAPPWRRIAVALALFVVWANVHALYAIGLLLLAAALPGFALRVWLARWVDPQERGAEASGREARRARRVGAALALGIAVSALNPTGFDQHLAFLRSSQEAAVWSVRDDWSPFDPFRWSHYGVALGWPAWLATDLLLVLFPLAGAWGLLSFARRPSAAFLRGADPVLFGLGIAACVAFLGSIRFLWLSVFPLLFLVRALDVGVAGRARLARGLAWSLCAAGLAVTLGAASPAGLGTALAKLPSRESYCSSPYDDRWYYTEGVRFLRETGVEGNLFNPYAMGGFLDYWVGPRLRTFVDGRMNVPAEVFREYHLVNRQRGGLFETFLDVLDRRRVDFFFGVGVPNGEPQTEATLYTTAHLERAPGWLLVSRSIRHAIYLRDVPRNRQNLRRIAAYYERAGVPFDPKAGFEAARVIRERADWAEAHNLLPQGYPEVLAARRDPTLRFAALEALGLAHALVGAYEEQLVIDREAILLRPRAKSPRRRLVYGLLRLDRGDAALAAALELERLDPDDPRSAAFVDVARQYAQRRRVFDRDPTLRRSPPLDAPINALPLVE